MAPVSSTTFPSSSTAQSFPARVRESNLPQFPFTSSLLKLKLEPEIHFVRSSELFLSKKKAKAGSVCVALGCVFSSYLEFCRCQSGGKKVLCCGCGLDLPCRFAERKAAWCGLGACRSKV